MRQVRKGQLDQKVIPVLPDRRDQPARQDQKATREHPAYKDQKVTREIPAQLAHRVRRESRDQREIKEIRDRPVR